MKPIRPARWAARSTPRPSGCCAVKQRNHTHFLAHGMGLVSHEAPRLTATGPVPYDDYDARGRSSPAW